MLSEFSNEPLTDFTKPENKAAMEAALATVRAEFGREYPLVIGGERITGLKTFESINPVAQVAAPGPIQQSDASSTSSKPLDAALESVRDRGSGSRSMSAPDCSSRRRS